MITIATEPKISLNADNSAQFIIVLHHAVGQYCLNRHRETNVCSWPKAATQVLNSWVTVFDPKRTVDGSTHSHLGMIVPAVPDSNISLSLRPILIGVVVIFVTSFLLGIATIPFVFSMLDFSSELNSTSDSPLGEIPWPAAITLSALSFLSFLVGGFVAAKLSKGRVVHHAIAAAVISATIMAISQVFDRDNGLVLLATVTVVSIAGAVLGGLVVQWSDTVRQSN